LILSSTFQYCTSLPYTIRSFVCLSTEDDASKVQDISLFWSSTGRTHMGYITRKIYHSKFIIIEVPDLLL
jgi:hypothetical protein